MRPRLAGPCVLAVALAAALARGALAQVATYHVEGDAAATAADPRVAALDVAFAAAVRQAVDELVAPAERKARKADLDREVHARARLWVASFKVTADTVAGDRRRLEVDVKIAHDKLRARLAELAIALEPAGGPVEPEPVVGPAPSRTATVLLAVTTPAGIVASYGPAAEGDVPGLAPLVAAVRAAGWQYVPAPAAGPPAHAGPLDDQAARALAGDAGAELAVIAGIDAAAPAPVRGSTELASLARARVRVIDRTGLVGQGSALGAARGVGDEILAAAIATAAADAFADARPASAAPVTGPVAALIPDADEVLVRVVARSRSEAPPWTMVRHIRDRLATLSGAQVAYRRLTTREVVIGVRGAIKPEKVAREIRDLERKITDTSFQTQVDGNQVEVRVSGSP
jgi:hypothetical protein